jgi:hypothetical protein
VKTVKESEPHEQGFPGHNWTIKKLQHWMQAAFGCKVSHGTVHEVLQENNLSWKKCQKVLKKADPAKRAAYMQVFEALYAQICQGKLRLLYLDESPFHRDMDLDYRWTECGKPAWRQSDCPPLHDRIDWYGVYDFANGQCFIWTRGRYNGENTAQFLKRVAA